MGLIRIGTGRDASDCAFATIFGTVVSAMPGVRITATTDRFEGLVEPFRHDDAVSTHPGPEARDNDALEQNAPMPHIMDRGAGVAGEQKGTVPLRIQLRVTGRSATTPRSITKSLSTMPAEWV